MSVVCLWLRGWAGGAVVGWRWFVEPHQRGQRGCRQRSAAVHSDPDSGRGRPASTGFLHIVPPQEEQTGTARRPWSLQTPHHSGQDYIKSPNPWLREWSCSETYHDLNVRKKLKVIWKQLLNIFNVLCLYLPQKMALNGVNWCISKCRFCS